MRCTGLTARLAAILTISGTSLTALANLPFDDPVPGGVAVLPLYASEHPKPEATFGRKRVRIVEHDGFWWAMPGIALDTVPGEYVVLVSLNDEIPHPVSFQVNPHPYPYVEEEVNQLRGVSRLGSLISGSNPDNGKVEDRRIENWQAQVNTGLPMSFPAEGDWNDLFGRSVINPSRPPRYEHHLELSASPNQLVLAPGRSLCLDISESINDNDDAETSNFDVTLDHGEGLISIIRGITDLTVQPGDEVQQGAMIGRFGRAGSGQRSQLEWLVLLNGEFVNPRLLTSSGELTVTAEDSISFPWPEPAEADAVPDPDVDIISDTESATPEAPASDTN